RAHIRDFRERSRAVPLVDRERKGAAHARVIERLALVIGRYHVAAVPVALLKDDLVAELARELLARGRRQAAELARPAAGADGVDAHRLLGRKDGGEAVEIRLPRMVIVGIAHDLDRLAGLVADEF